MDTTFSFKEPTNGDYGIYFSNIYESIVKDTYVKTVDNVRRNFYIELEDTYNFFELTENLLFDYEYEYY